MIRTLQKLPYFTIIFMKKTVFLLLILSTTLSLAQNIRLEGMVRDTLGKPLEMANVMAINEETKAMDGYGITNDKGRFQLNLKPNAIYKVKVSFIGFKTYEEIIQTNNEGMQKVFTLKEGGFMLDGVEVVQEMPVSISGDTIIYNADSFKTGTEQKLEDILKKLPGVQVNDDGEIEVEGRRVTQILVEGKKFFEGDTKLGSKNIPSDAVDKVQVLRNFNEVSQLKGLENNEENVAINIKLKKGKEKFWFGDITVGGGPDERFVVNPKVFYYSPKTSVNVISNFNNIGDVPFSNRDFFRLTGGSRNTIGRSGTNIGISSNDLGISTAQNDRALEIDNQFGAFNIAQEITKKWNVSGFGILSSNKTLTETISNFGFFRPNTTEVQTLETRNDFSDLRNNLAIFKVGSKFKPSTAFQLDYDASIRRSNQTEDNQLLSQSSQLVNGSFISNPLTRVASFKEQDPINFNQSLNMFWTQNEKSTWVLEMQHLYQNEDPFYNPVLETNENPFPIINFQGNGSGFDIQQQRFVQTNKFDAKLDYYYSITPKGILNITAGNTHAYQSYNSAILEMLDTGQVVVPESDFQISNNVQYAFNDRYVGAHYKFILGKFTFNPGFNMHAFRIYNDQLGSRVNDNFNRLLPDLFAQWQMKKSESMVYNYRMSNFFNDINTVIEGYTFNNFNALNAGNRNIQNALQESHNLRYTKYNLFNFTTIAGNINYTRTTDPIVSRTFLQGINTVSERVNADFTNENLSAFGSYQRSFAKYYKASATAVVNWSKNNVLFVIDPENPASDQINTFENITQRYNVSLGTQFRELPNIDFGYAVTINENPNTTFTTHSPFARLDYLFLKHFALRANYTYNDFSDRQGTIQNTYDLFNASLSYRKKDAKFEYTISGTNLLNTTSINRDSFNVFNFNSTQYFVQPRYLIFSLRYNL